jgi:hypothetical protein
MSVFFAQEKLRACEGCGCTDMNPCSDPPTGTPCSWVEGFDLDVCSVCASIAVRMAEAEEQDVADQIDESSRVAVYSPDEAQAFIESTRVARAGDAT